MDKKKVKAVLACTASLGIEVLDVEHGVQDKIVWKWSNEKKVHRSTVRDVAGKPCFRANRQWISLDGCLRTGIGS